MASASPRRFELLRQIGLRDFRVIAPEIDELMDETISMEEAISHISREKAAAVARLAKPDEVVIAADTMVCLEDMRLGKPIDKADAYRMLSLLSGKRHQVITAVTVIKGTERITETEITMVYFRKIRNWEIEAYIATGEPMDKAGAYAAQGIGSVFVERIEGDFFNVMGLPICRLSSMLERMGIYCLRTDGGPGDML